MASREKKPLAPAKSKQKANNNFGSTSIDTKSTKKTKSLIKDTIICDIIEAVATNSQLPPKLEAGLPRKKALGALKCKTQKLKVVKSGLLKAKQKVPIKSLKRINVNAKKTISKARKIKTEKEDTSNEKDCDVNAKVAVTGVEDTGKSAKNNIRTSNKKIKAGEKDQTAVKGVKKIDSPTARGIKSPKSLTLKAQNPKSRKSLTKEVVTESLKFDEKNSIDLTIDEVIAASVLSDSDELNDDKNKKMVNDMQTSILTEAEIKKEVIEPEEDVKVSDEEMLEQEVPSTNNVQINKKKPKTPSQRSLRNGKLRQHSDSGILVDLELSRRRKRLNSDDPAALDQASDGNQDSESCISENSTLEVQNIKEEDVTNHIDSVYEVSTELENNNNGSDQRVGEIGPTLRSKTKIRGSDESKVEDLKVDEKLVLKSEKTEEPRTMESLRKERFLAKLTAEKKCRRNSLNIEVKKAVNAFTPINNSDGSSQIDKMIENIKLTIAKSIESKIFVAEKSLLLSKNFEVPKIEEIVAPLSAETQKIGLEDNVDEEKPNNTKKDKKEAEDSVPKVADTAKEIEKLVMGDIESADNVSADKNDSAESNAVENDNQHNDHYSTNSAADDISTEMTKKCAAIPRKSSRTSSKTSSTDVSLELKVESLQTDDAVINDTHEDAKEEVETKKCTSPRKSPRTSKNISSTEVASETEVDGTESKNSDDKIEERKFDEDNASADEVSADSKKSPSVRKSARTLSKSFVESNVAEQDCLKTMDDEDNLKRVNNDTAESSTSNLDHLSVEVIKKNTNPRKSTRTASRNSSDISQDDVTKRGNKNKNSPIKVEKPEVVDFSENELEAAEMTQNVTGIFAEGESVNGDKSKDTETLESISMEVERLVGDIDMDSFVKEDKSDDVENISLAINDASASEIKSEAISKDVETELHITKGNESVTVEDRLKEVKSEELNKDGCDVTHEAEEQEEQQVVSGETVAVETKDESTSKAENSPKAKVPTTETEDNKSSPTLTRGEENKRVLRTRDKNQRKELKAPTEIKLEMVEIEANTSAAITTPEVAEEGSISGTQTTEPQIPRTRRSRELKRRKEEPPSQNSASKVRRTKKDSKKTIEQQNKEETLLDNEVAKINENKSNCLKMQKSRGNSEPATQNGTVKSERRESSSRSKSENDIERIDVVSVATKVHENRAVVGGATKPIDTDDTSTSGESSSSLQSIGNKDLVVARIASTNAPVDETQENLTLKVAMLGVLGLAPLDKVEKHLGQKMNQQYTGTLKTIIKVNPKDKKRSRSPLKMVLKQGRTEGDGETLEFYTIQKELGTAGLGDSSSGANRKITTNHRPLCDEDEETPPKDRQSLVIPEKSSSFSIHPERLCADVCCYCHGKFGSLDTPMHLAQMKSDDRMKKILVVERHLTKDSCLCDACFRHVDRKAHVSPTNMQSKPQKQHRQLMNTKCAARDCKETAKHNVKRRWLLKIKTCVQNQVDIDWESSQHSSMSFCVIHYPKIEKYLTCALCKRRLAKNQTHQLPQTETAELNQRLAQHGVPVEVVPATFVCKLCRYFTQLLLKYKDYENMSSSSKTFYKNYRKKILHSYNIEESQDDEDASTSQKDKDVTTKDKDKEPKDKPHTPAKKTSKCSQSRQQPAKPSTSSKSPDLPSTASNPPSRKSTPEPLKTSTPITTMESTQSRLSKSSSSSSAICHEDTHPKASTHTSSSSSTPSIQYLTIESTIEKLKKRKAIDNAHNYSSSSTSQTTSDVVEILAMDKEVTLTRLPKRPKTAATTTSNNSQQDITPVVQRLGANPSISVRTLFPGEEEMNLQANIEFNNVREVTPQGWEKCSSIIQYDRDTKLLWQTLQRPYGNQSSFLRHLILLEKYYRAGDLVLAPKASHNALNYSTSVRNRLISYEGPEKADEPITEPILPEYPSPSQHRGGALLNSGVTYEQPRPGTSKVMTALNSGVSIIKKPPPNLQRINMPSTSQAGNRKPIASSTPKQPISAMPGGQVFQMSEPEYKKLQTLKKQKQMNAVEKTPPSVGTFKGQNTQYQQKPPQISQLQFQKHVRMQQEMLNRQSRGDFEPIICDARPLANENNPAQSLLNNLNLPKSIQVTTKPTVPISIPIMPKIPKSLTVIPQTITKPSDK